MSDPNPNVGPTGLRSRLRAAVAARLAAGEAFAGNNEVPVVDGGLSDLQKTVADALTKRASGLCLVVSIPKVDLGTVSPEHRIFTVAIQIYESPVRNWSEKGRRLSIEDAAEAVDLLLNFTDEGQPGWSPDATWTRFNFDGARIVFANSAQNTFEVTFTTQTLLQIQVTE
jgi:hypothetical protein